ncbi:hypothetical protein RN87_03825 [Fusobacterium hwasookii ChDC F174]|uniref:Uncharacterized protein n=1 Tax=Fusobacterium hwasookii ChDC F174 TaxID=1307442 RepID=A0A0S2ZL39_9FUSO|nr:hypothetical protein RN87_03825 [Fusobacterium hwasookii ChDC F174]
MPKRQCYKLEAKALQFGLPFNHKPPLQVVVCTMPKRQCYKLEAKALQFGLPFAYSPIQLLK